VSVQSAESFLEACGAAAPLRFCVERSGANPRHFETGRPFVRVGRDQKTDVVLQHTDVSRSHTYLQIVCGRLLCLDLASRTGTHWPDRRAASGWIEPGDSVAIGPFQVHLHRAIEVVAGCPPPPTNPLKSNPADRESLPVVTLEFVNARKGQQWAQLTRRVTLIGRAPICKISFDDSSVARVHCSLVLTPNGVYVVNLVGRGGIRVNGEPVAYTRLDDGAQLQIGKFVARLHYENEPTNDVQLVATSTATPHAPSRENALVAAQEITHPRSNQLILRPLSVLAGPARFSVPTASSATLPKLFAPEHAGPILPLNESSADGLARALVAQMTSFHQQMFEQNQQTISMIVQLFGRMHREHVELVHEELTRLQQLTEEFRLIQSELARVSLARAPAPPRQQTVAQAPVPKAIEAAASEPSPNAPALQPSVGGMSLSAADAAMPPGDIPATDSTSPATHADGSPSHPAALPEALVASAPEPESGGAAAVAPATSPIPATLTNPEDIHVWLVDRMASIEAERQSLWERVCNAIKLP
jgi:pSer/pThr/pTyr-binding forkhead associated (FHA) protein